MLVEIKKQNDILRDMALALEGSGVLPSPNALMDADANASDPMVQMYAGFSAALSEVYLQVEALQNQLDYRTADVNWLAALHGSRFGIDLTGRTEADARKLIEQLDKDGVRNGDLVIAAMRAENVAYAKAVYGTETMLIVQNKQGEVIPDGAIAQQLYEGIPTGFYTLVGDKVDTYVLDGECYDYRYQPAERVIIALEIHGQISECAPDQWAQIANQVVKTFNCEKRYSLGGTVGSVEILQSIEKIAGVKLNSVKISKRGAKFIAEECAPELVDFYDCDGVLETVDFTNKSPQECANSAGYFWCKDFSDCVPMKPWEYPVLHPMHITFVEESAQC
ncbi:hypothetical protein GCM10009007_03510 [Formosimonas limnophila]|uniref:Uncharacterized protein n=1 Tax=Formosimonas limnophila TaxID=1384487 RepID=A0A8J3CJS7_9BURK|nr:hypothetical protein [Formosimonas limnophila]GHA66334.1 hypothetical protein GCM10009007_03510 [Formosimonas limnophila]